MFVCFLLRESLGGKKGENIWKHLSDLVCSLLKRGDSQALKHPQFAHPFFPGKIAIKVEKSIKTHISSLQSLQYNTAKGATFPPSVNNTIPFSRLLLLLLLHPQISHFFFAARNTQKSRPTPPPPEFPWDILFYLSSSASVSARASFFVLFSLAKSGRELADIAPPFAMKFLAF